MTTHVFVLALNKTEFHNWVIDNPIFSRSRISWLHRPDQLRGFHQPVVIRLPSTKTLDLTPEMEDSLELCQAVELKLPDTEPPFPKWSFVPRF